MYVIWRHHIFFGFVFLIKEYERKTTRYVWEDIEDDKEKGETEVVLSKNILLNSHEFIYVYLQINQ